MHLLSEAALTDSPSKIDITMLYFSYQPCQAGAGAGLPLNSTHRFGSRERPGAGAMGRSAEKSLE
jgi:hypothetical protein